MLAEIDVKDIKDGEKVYGWKNRYIRMTFEEILDEMFGQISTPKVIPQTQIKQLKKQIKYSKNLLEIKQLNKELNELYKEIKRNKREEVRD